MVYNIVIVVEAGYNGNLTGVHKKCTQYKCSHNISGKTEREKTMIYCDNNLNPTWTGPYQHERKRINQNTQRCWCRRLFYQLVLE